MKKLLLSLTLVAFALAVQAGENKETTKSSTSKISTTTPKAECTADKAKDGASCSACCKPEAKKQVVKQTLLSPKAAAEKGT